MGLRIRHRPDVKKYGAELQEMLEAFDSEIAQAYHRVAMWCPGETTRKHDPLCVQHGRYEKQMPIYLDSIMSDKDLTECLCRLFEDPASDTGWRERLSSIHPFAAAKVGSRMTSEIACDMMFLGLQFPIQALYGMCHEEADDEGRHVTRADFVQYMPSLARRLGLPRRTRYANARLTFRGNKEHREATEIADPLLNPHMCELLIRCERAGFRFDDAREFARFYKGFDRRMTKGDDSDEAEGAFQQACIDTVALLETQYPALKGQPLSARELLCSLDFFGAARGYLPLPQCHALAVRCERAKISLATVIELMQGTSDEWMSTLLAILGTDGALYEPFLKAIIRDPSFLRQRPVDEIIALLSDWHSAKRPCPIEEFEHRQISHVS